MRQLGAVLVAHLVEHRETALVVGRQGHLEMRDLDATFVQTRLHAGGQVAEPGVAVKRSALQADAGVEPSQQGFAFAVDGVVNLQIRLRALAVAFDGGHDRLEPFVEALAGTRRHHEDLRARKFALERGAQGGDPRRFDDIALVDDEDRGLFELLAIQ